MSSKHKYVISGSKRAMVWLDEKPVWEEFTALTQARTFEAANVDTPRNVYVALELNIPSGPMVQYAMIGATFCLDGSETVRLTISCVGDSGKTFPSEIATEKEAVFCGIPEEYIASILDTVKHTKLPGGEIIIDRGAHSVYGSSPHIFKKTTALLLDLARRGEQNDLQEFLQDRLSVSREA